MSLVLRLSYPPSGSNSDPRTFNVYRTSDGSADQVELYKFYHPNTGSKIGATTFHRKNMTTLKWETAGEIDWSSDTNATSIYTGDGNAQVSIRDLRAVKNNSQSRRFKVSGSEYKWKIAEGGVDIFCVDSSGKNIATWTEGELTLRVETRAESILDRLMVTCLLNIWMKRLGQW